MRTASDGTFEWTFPPDFQTTDYYLRAAHSRYNFSGPVLLSHASPNLNQPLGLNATSVVPTPSVGPRFSGTTRNKAFVTFDCLPSSGDLRNSFGVAGNSIGLPSSFPLKLGNCQVVKTARGPVAGGWAYLTGMTGKVFIMGDYTYSWSIVPPVQTVVDFTIDLDGNARWGCTNLAQAVRASDTLTVNVGGHPGTLAVEICLNWSPSAVAGARISHGYRAVRNALSYYTAGELNAAEVQGLRQALDNLPLTIGTPATAEARMREAVSRVTNTQVKEVLGRTFDIALGQFPTLAAGEQWELLWDEIRCTVQPNVTQADSHAVAPSFVVAPSRPRFTDTLRQQSAQTPVSSASPGLAQKPAIETLARARLLRPPRRRQRLRREPGWKARRPQRHRPQRHRPQRSRPLRPPSESTTLRRRCSVWRTPSVARTRSRSPSTARSTA